MHRGGARKRNRVQDINADDPNKTKNQTTKEVRTDDNNNDDDHNNNNNTDNDNAAVVKPEPSPSNRNANAKEKNEEQPQPQTGNSYSQYTTYTEYLESLHKEHEESQDVIEDDWELVYCLMRIIVIIFPISLAIILLPVYYTCSSNPDLSRVDRDIRTTIGLLQPFLSITISILIATFTQPKQAINVPVDITQKRGLRDSQDSGRTGYDADRGSRDDEGSVDDDDDGDPTKPQEQDFRTLARALARAKALYRTNKENEVNDTKNMRENLNMNAASDFSASEGSDAYGLAADSAAVYAEAAAAAVAAGYVVSDSNVVVVGGGSYEIGAAQSGGATAVDENEDEDAHVRLGKSAEGDTNLPRSATSLQDADGKPFFFNEYNNNSNNSNSINLNVNNNNSNNNKQSKNRRKPTLTPAADSAVVEVPEVAVVGVGRAAGTPLSAASEADGGASSAAGSGTDDDDDDDNEEYGFDEEINYSSNAWPWSSGNKKNTSEDVSAEEGKGRRSQRGSNPGIMKRRLSNKVDPNDDGFGAETEAGEGDAGAGDAAAGSTTSPYRCPAIVLIIFFSFWIIMMFVLLGVFHFGKGC